MSTIPDEAIAKAREADIVGVINEHVFLVQKGSSWIGDCPFCKGSKPTLAVNRESGVFLCFRCDASGSVIDFVSRIMDITFREAVADLGRWKNPILGLPPVSLDLPDPVVLTEAEEERAEKYRSMRATAVSGHVELMMVSLRLFVRMELENENRGK